MNMMAQMQPLAKGDHVLCIAKSWKGPADEGSCPAPYALSFNTENKYM